MPTRRNVPGALPVLALLGLLGLLIRHHQGAIDMCNRDLSQRRHPGARTMSGKIAADQAAEVKEMQELLAGL